MSNNLEGPSVLFYIGIICLIVAGALLYGPYYLIVIGIIFCALGLLG